MELVGTELRIFADEVFRSQTIVMKCLYQWLVFYNTKKRR
jgi:hypothetical protein